MTCRVKKHNSQVLGTCKINSCHGILWNLLNTPPTQRCTLIIIMASSWLVTKLIFNCLNYIQLPEVQRGATSESLRCLYRVLVAGYVNMIRTRHHHNRKYIYGNMLNNLLLNNLEHSMFKWSRPSKMAFLCAGATSSQASAEKALQAVLEEMPHVLPFEVGNGQMWMCSAPIKEYSSPRGCLPLLCIDHVLLQLFSCYQYVRPCRVGMEIN